MDVDVFAYSLRLVMSEVPGSITGAHSNFGPVMRVNVGDLFFPGEYLTGITQTSGPTTSAFLTGPTSVAFDFDDFSARTMDFQLITTVPEPVGACGLLVIPIFIRRRRSGPGTGRLS
jgi:hypothetical protein